MWTVKKRRLRSADLFIVPGRSCNCSANTNLSMVASISANCELGFWQSSELLWYMRKVVNICDGCHGSHWGHWLWPPSLESLSDALSTVAPSKMLLGWLAMVASSVATMLSSAKTKCMSSRQRVTRYDPLVDTTQPVHIPQWQVWHVPSAQCAFSALWFGRDGSDSKFQASPSDSAISVPRHQRGERLNCNCPLPSVTSSAMPASFFARPRM